MSKALLLKLTDDELRRELQLWQAACALTKVRTFVRMADDRRNAVTAEGWRRRPDFWRRVQP